MEVNQTTEVICTMKNLPFLLVFIIATSKVIGQYPFEKFPALKLEAYSNWKTDDTGDQIRHSLTVNRFFEDADAVTIRLTSDKKNWPLNSGIELFKAGKQILRFKENTGFPSAALDSVRIGDIDKDGLKDLKLIISYMGNGLASLNVRVIYALQRPNHSFKIVAFDDKMDYGNDRRERDFDGDGKFEVITMTLQNYKNHNYWLFNIYDFTHAGLENANEKAGYPIMIQLLYKENYKITTHLSRKEMKKFAKLKPDGYLEK